MGFKTPCHIDENSLLFEMAKAKPALVDESGASGIYGSVYILPGSRRYAADQFAG